MMSEYTMNSKDFYKALTKNKLIGSRCIQCHALAIPQRQICPKCQSNKTEIVGLSGNGKLVAFTVISVPPRMMAEAGYNAGNPYCVGIVELSEGLRVSAQILDVDVSKPESIKVGTPVRMTTIARGEIDSQTKYLGFVPIKE
jgi:uncharacterized OB-fold protein